MRQNMLAEIIPDNTFGFMNFLEALADCELCLNASSLENIYTSSDEIQYAVEKAMIICSVAGLPLRAHFKRVYISDEQTHVVKTDWKISKTAYRLTLINGYPGNPVVGRTQLEILRRLAR